MIAITRDQGRRLFSKFTVGDGCWLWHAGRYSAGYGSIKSGGVIYLAHRFVYEILVGPIPAGLEIDHLCGVRNCVRPDHLEPVTHAENVRRGKSGEWGRSKTHCPAGHPYDETNTYVYPASSPNAGARACRICSARARARYEAARSA